MINIRQNHAFIYIIMAILLQALSGIFSKYASMSLHGGELIQIIINSYYLLSLICLIFQALVWQVVLKHYDLSFAYPFISLVNFIILVSSYLLFNESITLANLIGLFFISCGVYLLSREVVKA